MQPTMSGTGARNPKLGWARARLTRTKGEKPKKRPPTMAAGVQRTHRRSNQNIARAETGGDTRSMRFNDATGPNSQVTGAAPIPSPSEFGAMLMPRGHQELGREERIETVAERVGRPPDDPQSERRVTAPAGGDRVRMGQDVPPQDHGQGQIATPGQEVHPPSTTGRRAIASGTNRSFGVRWIRIEWIARSSGRPDRDFFLLRRAPLLCHRLTHMGRRCSTITGGGHSAAAQSISIFSGSHSDHR